MNERMPTILRTLQFRSAADFLDKLNREIERAKDAGETLEAIDHATNAVMTAWHLTDWVWSDIEKDRTAPPFRLIAKRAGGAVRSLKDFQDFVRKNENIVYCESIAVATKHFGSSGPEFSADVQSRTEQTSDPRKATALVFTTSDLGTEMRSIRTVSEIVLVEEGGSRPVLEILIAVRDWWTELLN